MLRPNTITVPVISQKLSSFEILKSYDKLLVRDKEVVNDEINNTHLKLFYGKTWYIEDTIFIRIVDNSVVSDPNFVDIKLTKEEYNSDDFRDIIKKKLDSSDIKFLANGYQISKTGLYKTRNGKRAFISFVWKKGDCEYTEDGYTKDFVNECVGIVEDNTNITRWNIEDGKEILTSLRINGIADFNISGKVYMCGGCRCCGNYYEDPIDGLCKHYMYIKYINENSSDHEKIEFINYMKYLRRLSLKENMKCFYGSSTLKKIEYLNEYLVEFNKKCNYNLKLEDLDDDNLIKRLFN